MKQSKRYYIIQLDPFSTAPYFCKSASRNLKTHSSIMGTFSNGDTFFAVRASDNRILSSVQYFAEHHEYRYVTIEDAATFEW